MRGSWLGVTKSKATRGGKGCDMDSVGAGASGTGYGQGVEFGFRRKTSRKE